MSKHDVALVSSFPVIQASQGRIQDFLMGSGGGGGGLTDINWPKNYTFTLF